LIENDDFLVEVLSNAQHVVDSSPLGDKLFACANIKGNYPSASGTLATHARTEKAITYSAQTGQFRRH